MFIHRGALLSVVTSPVGRGLHSDLTPQLTLAQDNYLLLSTAAQNCPLRAASCTAEGQHLRRQREVGAA